MPPLLVSAGHIVMNCQEIHDAISNELIRIGSATFLDFDSAGSFIFIEDPCSHFLEPVFTSLQRPYQLLDAVSTGYGSLDDVRSKPQSIEDAGIASVANQDGFAFSQDPETDIRFGERARILHSAYGIRGSLMAIRLNDLLGIPLGVFVVHAANKLGGITTAHETVLLAALETELGHVRALLQLRREAFARRELACCQNLLIRSSHHARTPRTVARTCGDFISMCLPLFNANALYIFHHDDPMHSRWHPTLTPAQSAALDSLVNHAPNESVFTLNRRRQAQPLADSLEAAFGGYYVWCRIEAHVYGQRIIAIANRKAHSISDHWERNDVALLSQAIDVLGVHLARSNHFDRLLTHITKVNGKQSKHDRFQFLAHILNDYFGFDQVLLAKVKKKPDRYKICVEFLTGFGKHEPEMKRRPKEYVPGQSHPGTPDVMSRILDDFVNDRLRASYPANVDHPADDYCLDKQLLDTCALKGHMYFFPCCTSDTATPRGTLESILHVGSTDGAAVLDLDSYPLMKTLSDRVAEWLVGEGSREAANVCRDIRDIDQCRAANMQHICEMVADATASLGCTLFLNAEKLPLLGIAWSSPEAISEAMVRLVNRCDSWKELLGADRCRRLIDMFASFLGIPNDITARILSRPRAEQIARLAAEVLYVRAAQSNGRGAGEDLQRLLDAKGDMGRDEFVIEFGAFLLANAYLPGYGLTGWVLRHRQQMSLADKSPHSLSRFHSAVKDLDEPVWKSALLRALHACGVHSSTLEDSHYGMPCHADHISEDPDRHAPHDSYLACAIEGIESPERPVGAIRISNSARVRRGFSDDDERTVVEAARHVSHLLRREYMRQDVFLSRMLDRRGDEDDFYHCIKRLHDKIYDLRGYLADPGVKWPDAERTAIEDTVGRLEELCDSAIGAPQQRILAWRICQADTEKWPLATVAAFLKDWLSNENLHADVSVEDSQAAVGWGAEIVTWAFRVVHELAKNLRWHQRILSPAVAVRGGESIAFYVGSANALSCYKDGVWRPYIRLAAGKQSGGGTRLISEASALAGLDVEYTFVEIARDGGQGVRSEMVARVKRHIAGSRQ